MEFNDHKHWIEFTVSCSIVETFFSGYLLDSMDSMDINWLMHEHFCLISRTFLYFSYWRRHSDDPLISGALDDNQNEFDTIAGCGNSLAAIKSPPTNFNKKPTRTRKSGNIKLRFHHQALPQEYLEHYEASQNQFHTKELTIGALSPKLRSSKKDRTATTTVQPSSPANDLSEQEPVDSKSEKSVQMWLQKSSKHQNGRDSNSRADNELKAALKQSSKVSAHDLPYMGEITLDNFKPRRGRKPKKADICHLIYKNYGTVFPNHKTNDSEPDVANTSAENINRSLLEKRLTQNADEQPDSMCHDGKGGAEEPLNLCVRDRYDDDVMTVISDDDAIDTEKLSDFKSDISMLSPNDALTSVHFPRNLKMALPNFQSALLDGKNELSEAGIDVDSDINKYNCWQNSGMFINPMVLYLQKMANSNQSVPSSYSPNSSGTPKTQAIDSPTDTNSTRTRQKRMLVPKKMSQLLKDEAAHPDTVRSSPIPAASGSNKSASQAKERNPNAPKRKRSAIFIPPLPEESSTNHATEVSICKFKFTGGAKPSLQEKKMLSVDAGGNFRYYSGTGDKSIRGYEFFPRESLKQSSLMSASSAGAFLNTPGQKITNDIPPPSFGLSNELLQIPEINTPSSVGILSSQNTPTGSMTPQQMQHSKQHYHSSRKRKSKRSMQREKLEKTFKEKGFLIQTQQLEQAEGTYCKFRQLRKFTRYLFRSWKDYLPGELNQNQTQNSAVGGGVNQPGTSSASDRNGLETTSSHFIPSPSSSHDEWMKEIAHFLLTLRNVSFV